MENQSISQRYADNSASARVVLVEIVIPATRAASEVQYAINSAVQKALGLSGLQFNSRILTTYDLRREG